MRLNRCLVAALAALTVAGSSVAATVNTTFLVSATVLNTCLVTALPLAFGNYDPNSGTALDGSTTVTVTCTIGTNYAVGLDAGTTAGGSDTNPRKLTDGTNTLDYGLYKDAARTTAWGNTGTDRVSATAVLLPTAHTVYGRIGTGQNVPAGLYTDTITATVTY